jgi:predicted Fe-Mo cluster-binding NifX family protein
MKVCFPVENNQGLASAVFGHFGSAPLFVVVDTETGQVAEVINRDLHHAHGACSPVKALGGHTVDAVVVGGIGGGALNGLSRAGIRVYRAGGPTIAENVTRLRDGGLTQWAPGETCGGHGHGHGCSH